MRFEECSHVALAHQPGAAKWNCQVGFEHERRRHGLDVLPERGDVGRGDRLQVYRVDVIVVLVSARGGMRRTERVEGGIKRGRWRLDGKELLDGERHDGGGWWMGVETEVEVEVRLSAWLPC